VQAVLGSKLPHIAPHCSQQALRIIKVCLEQAAQELLGIMGIAREIDNPVAKVAKEQNQQEV